MVADEAADLGLAGGDGVAGDRDEDLAVVVPEVAVGGDRAQVDPLADVGVAEEPLVVLVRVAVDDARLDLATDPAVRADGGPPPDVGPEQLGFSADVAAAVAGSGFDSGLSSGFAADFSSDFGADGASDFSSGLAAG